MKEGYGVVTEFIESGKTFTVYRSNTDPKDEIIIEDEKKNKKNKVKEKITKVNIKEDILPNLLRKSLIKRGLSNEEIDKEIENLKNKKVKD